MLYYDYQKILSYNAPINILIGERGVGKTFGATKYVINRFLKHNEKFAYIRRYKTEIAKAVPKFFNSIIKENTFKDTLLTTKGNNFYVNDELAGYAMTLSTAQDLKGSTFSDVKTIIFDEFIIEPGQRKIYLKDEVFVFLNLIETLMRMKDFKCFMLGNPANIFSNPYFLYFGLSLPYNSDIKLFKDNLILVQLMQNTEYREAKKQTKFGKLIAGTSYENYAVNNNPLYNMNKNFIEKKTGTAKYGFTIIYSGFYYGIWYDYSNSKIFVSFDYDKSCPICFSCTLDDHTPNTMLLKGAKNMKIWKTFIDNFKMGNVRFENNKIKNNINELVRTILTL